jgi:hypothetical protein
MSDDFDVNKHLNWFSSRAPKARQIHAGEKLPEIDLGGIQLIDGTEDLIPILDMIRLPKRRSFYLGMVTTGTFLMQSSASHRVLRGKRGTGWELFSSSSDAPGVEEHVGTYTPEQILNIVENLGYDKSMNEWIAMGWRPS